MQLKEKGYYNEITNIIEKVEINRKVRELKDNSDKLKAYFNIGKLIVNAQGGIKRANYGNELIKNWAIKLTKKYGKGYTSTNLRYFRQFYLNFTNYHTVCDKLSWSIIRIILPINNKNERNYYINQVILNDLSVRQLQQEIKSNSFDRLSYADKENIKLLGSDDYSLTMEDMIKDPILIKTTKMIDNLDEKALHIYIIEMLEDRFIELGVSMALVGHEYKINVEGHRYSLDLLFFNIKLNCYVVVELKTRAMKISDCDQVKFYTNLVDKHIKEARHNKTVGLLIAREKDKFIIKYATDNNIFTSTYELI